MELTLNFQRHTVGGCDVCTRDCRNNTHREENEDMASVDQIIANTNCTEQDRPWLRELDPRQLDLLMPASGLTLNCGSCSCDQGSRVQTNRVEPLLAPAYADYLDEDSERVTVNRQPSRGGRVEPLPMPSQADYAVRR